MHPVIASYQGRHGGRDRKIRSEASIKINEVDQVVFYVIDNTHIDGIDTIRKVNCFKRRIKLKQTLLQTLKKLTVRIH